MINTFFTSDTHFFHKSIMRFCPETRAGADADEMTDLLIQSWNEQVGPHDHVWHLGDVSFGQSEKTARALNKLNGVIHLVKGNHDDRNMMNHIAGRFDSVQDYKYLRLNGNKFVLFHYPIKEWNSCQHGSIHLYGHVHGRDVGLDGKCMDVGIDTRSNFKLYTEEEILTIMEDKPVVGHH